MYTPWSKYFERIHYLSFPFFPFSFKDPDPQPLQSKHRLTIPPLHQIPAFSRNYLSLSLSISFFTSHFFSLCSTFYFFSLYFSLCFPFLSQFISVFLFSFFLSLFFYGSGSVTLQLKACKHSKQSHPLIKSQPFQVVSSPSGISQLFSESS